MAPKYETARAASPLLTEAWVWPVTAAIVIGGSILFWCFVGLFWLATHPPKQSVVISVAPIEAQADQQQIQDYPTLAISDSPQ
jgi:hypothetical protein